MYVLKRSDHGYIQDPTKNLGFEKFDGFGLPDVVLIVAAFETMASWEHLGLTDIEIKKIKKMKVVRLEFEEPNKFFNNENYSYDNDFYKIFTLCPFTAEYLNDQQGCERRIPIFFPFNENFIPTKKNKTFDIIYTGHLHPKPVLRDIKIISRFDYRLVSNSNHSLVTHRGVDYIEKIHLISQSRITLVHNLLYPNFKHLRNVWRYKNWCENRAFSQLPGPLNVPRFLINRIDMVVPQLKSRVFEAAFSRSLILCKKDPFNVIERYFEPDREFIYYEEGQLAETISAILSSYDDYKPIVERAFVRAQRDYTTTAFFNKYLNSAL